MNTVLLRIAIDLNIFKLLVEKEEPMSTKELAEVTGADRVLLGRILRCLAATNVLEEVEVETYVPTKIGSTFAGEFGIVNLKCLYYLLLSVLANRATVFLRKAKLTTASPYIIVSTVWSTHGINCRSSCGKIDTKSQQIR